MCVAPELWRPQPGYLKHRLFFRLSRYRQKLQQQVQAQEDRNQAAGRVEVNAQAEEKARLEKAEQDARARRAKEKEKEKGKGKVQRPETRYGRKELHVAGDKSGRRKRKAPIRRRPVARGGDAQHGFEKPTAHVVREVEIPESIAVSELADSSVNLVVRPWCKAEDYWNVKFDLTRKIKEALEEAGCSIPFPQHDVTLITQVASGQ